MAVSVVAGLGNPGLAYAETRHNAGFMLVDALAKDWGCADWVRDRKADALYTSGFRNGKRVYLVKPQTYVNRSGSSLQTFCSFYRLPEESLAVVYDEINLPAGRAKVSVGGSAGGHNGVADILRFFANTFVRFRVGIGPKSPPEIEMKDFVLGRWRPDETAALQEAMNGFLEGLNLLIDSGPQTAMNRVNQRPPKADHKKQSNKTLPGEAETTEDNDSGEKKIPGYGDPGSART
jgi:peptidyl-tRNA hydrolase, PTH1 family